MTVSRRLSEESTFETSEGHDTYVYHIHLRPLLVVKNNLPILLRYHHSITPRKNENDYHDLNPGEEHSLYALNDAEEGHGDLVVKVSKWANLEN